MLKIHNNPPRREWPALTARCTRQEGEITERVAAILSQVRTGGDKALRDLVARIEGYVPERFEVSRRQRTEAAKAVPQRLKTALAIAKSNIEAFHRAQLPPQVDIEVMPGVRCVQRAVAIGRVGLYVPGGNAPLFSTVLMLALPARIAGCGEVILCTPAGRGGKIAPEVLFAADLCGVDRIFAVGGAQAVAAMAYGTESIPHVEKIFGPGNRYVTRAKQLVSAQAVAVDLPAGPSEVMVLADNSARAEFVAADLLSQAEHGDDSQAILVCRTERFARQVTRAVEEQIRYLSRGEAIRNLTMDERMTVCNMSIEAGARAGMIAPDETTFEYLKGRPHAPEGELWDQAVAYWKTLKTDDDAVFDKVVDIEVSDERIIQRLSGRRVCSACGASYHTTAKPSVKPDVCDRCGGALIVRKDDEPAIIDLSQVPEALFLRPMRAADRSRYWTTFS